MSERVLTLGIEADGTWLVNLKPVPVYENGVPVGEKSAGQVRMRRCPHCEQAIWVGSQLCGGCDMPVEN